MRESWRAASSFLTFSRSGVRGKIINIQEKRIQNDTISSRLERRGKRLKVNEEGYIKIKRN